MPKVGIDTGKGVTINVEKASGTVVIGDSASVTNHFHGELQSPIADENSQLMDALISEVARSRTVDPRSIETDLAKALRIADISLIRTDQYADAVSILSRWREEGIKEAVDTVTEAIRSFEASSP
jgi:hypothetical protein